MTRLVALSDVHGNLPALEAVLADIQTQGAPDAIWVLGDLAAFCPWPTETLARLRELPNVAERDANFRWTVEQFSYADYEFLRTLPSRLEMDVPGYGRVVAVHATPTDDEAVIFPDTPDDQVRFHLSGLDARLLLYGHTHRPLDRIVDGVRLVNDGSVGLPLDGDLRAAYALLDFEGDQCAVAIHRVAYDVEAVIAELERVEHPARGWVGQKLREAGG
jgi:diadenosine tetraphosphatase ApaH/serine/threonine PP2A family protein phosphatase